MRHSSKMRSFKQIQEDMKKSYGADDIKKFWPFKKGGRTIRFNNMISPEAAGNIRDNIKNQKNNNNDQSYMYRNQDENTAVGTILDNNAVTDTIISRSFPFGSKTKDFMAVPKFKEKKPKNKKPIQYRGRIANQGAINEWGLVTSSTGDGGGSKRDRLVWNDRRKRFIDDATGGSRVGYNMVKLKENEDGDQVLDLSMPVDLDNENGDPGIAQTINDFETNSNNNIKTAYGALSLTGNHIGANGVLSDRNADKIRTIRGLQNLDDDTVQSMSAVAGFLRTSLKDPVDGSSNNFTPGESPGIYFENGNSMLNSPGYAGNNPVRFHEIFHAVQAARAALCSKTTKKVGHIEVYESDMAVLNGVLDMLSNIKEIYNPEEWEAYYNDISVNHYREDLQRNTVNNMLGDITINCLMLRDLIVGRNVLSGSSGLEVGTRGHMLLGHNPEYYREFDDFGGSPEVVHAVVNEILSNVISIHANGDLGKPFVKKVLDPFIPAYQGFVHDFLSIMPHPEQLSAEDKKELRRNLFNGRDNKEAQAIMTKYTPKSASFRDMMRSKPNFKSKFISSIKKIDQSKLQFNGGRKVAAQYSMLPQNHNEYVALDTLNRYDPDLVRDTIGVDFNEVFEPFRDNGNPKSDEWYKSSGSRYGRRDMQFKQNSYDGGYILDAKKPVDVKWENKSPEIREKLARQKDALQSDDFMQKIRAKTSLFDDTISDQYHDLNWMGNISQGSKEALGRSADTIQFATYYGDPAYVVNSSGGQLRLENGDEWLNDETGDESVHGHEVRHVANNMVSALDPSYFVLNTQHYPAPVYEGTIPFIKGLWRINDIYGLEDSDEGESLARWIMNARLPRGSKNALFEVLFGAAIVPKLLNGYTTDDIQGMLDDNEVLHDIDEKFMPHNFAYYVNRSGSWEGKYGEYDTANLIHAYVDEIVAGMQQLESNKNINLEFVYPLHDAYFDLTKKVNEHLPDNISNNDRLDLMMAVQTAKNNDRQHYLRTYLPEIRRMLTRNYGVGKSASRKKP